MLHNEFDINNSYFFERIENGRRLKEYSTDVRIVSLDALMNDSSESFSILSYDYVNNVEKVKVKESEFPKYIILEPVVKSNEEVEGNGDFKILNVRMPEKERYIRNVEKAKYHIREGESFQIVISHRIEFDIHGSKFSMFEKMRKLNISHYNFFVHYDDVTVFGTSPERLILIENDKIYTNPIAGTIKISDKNSGLELLNSEKDLAEHNMLVDLSRNDVGRVSEEGSVNVEEYLKLKEYRGIYHLVSTVTGKLRKDRKKIDALNSLIPAGTVSGAPKIRSMEIIDALEEHPRGPYAGTFGIARKDEWDFGITIRSVVCKGDHCYIQAGAGIVYYSDPESEYYETINKMRSTVGGLVF